MFKKNGSKLLHQLFSNKRGQQLFPSSCPFSIPSNNFNNPTTLKSRGEHWSEIKRKSEDEEHIYDVVVIGGGVVGAAIIHEAKLRNKSALLVTSNDFASGSSSHSTKLTYNAVKLFEDRFKQWLNPRYVIHMWLTGKERVYLRRAGGDMFLNNVGLLIPHNYIELPKMLKRYSIIKINEVLSQLSGNVDFFMKGASIISRRTAASFAKPARNYPFSILSYDMQHIDHRSVFHILNSAVQKQTNKKKKEKTANVDIINYTQISNINIKDEGHPEQKIESIQLRDKLETSDSKFGNIITVKGRYYINATGQFNDIKKHLIARNDSRINKVSTISGVHMIFPKHILHWNMGNVGMMLTDRLRKFSNSSACFMIPYRGDYVLAGISEREDEDLNDTGYDLEIHNSSSRQALTSSSSSSSSSLNRNTTTVLSSSNSAIVNDEDVRAICNQLAKMLKCETEVLFNSIQSFYKSQRTLSLPETTHFVDLLNGSKLKSILFGRKKNKDQTNNQPGGSVVAVSPNHVLYRDGINMLTVIGGKWPMHRLIAAQIFRFVQDGYKQDEEEKQSGFTEEKEKSKTKNPFVLFVRSILDSINHYRHIRLSRSSRWSASLPSERFKHAEFSAVTTPGGQQRDYLFYVACREFPLVSPQVIRRLIDLYGYNAWDLLWEGQMKGLNIPVEPGCKDLLQSEVNWSVNRELATSSSDILFRRNGLGYVNVREAANLLVSLNQYLMKTLNWNEEQRINDLKECARTLNDMVPYTVNTLIDIIS